MSKKGKKKGSNDQRLANVLLVTAIIELLNKGIELLLKLID